MTSIELEDLSQRRKPAEEPNLAPDSQENTYYVQASVLSLLGILLSLFPGFVKYLAADGGIEPSPLERFLSVHFGIYLLAFAISLLLNTEAHPLLIPLTAAASLSSFIAYNTTPSHSLATIVFLASLAVAASGYVTILFANDPTSRSKTTGADKRTSAFMFGNQSAASQIKKRWRSGQAAAAR